MARSKMDKMERNLAAGIRLRQSAKEVWAERRAKSQDAQFAMAIANWVPSEELARGINKVLTQQIKRREVLIKFAENWHGELQKLGFKAVWRHCQRYSIIFSLEDARDAIAEAVANLFEEGKLAASLEQNKLSLEREKKIMFCWDAIHAYRRYIHPGKKQSDVALDVILGMEEFYQWRPAGPEEELNWVELKESLRQTLSNTDYAACHLLLQGYSKGSCPLAQSGQKDPAKRARSITCREAAKNPKMSRI